MHCPFPISVRTSFPTSVRTSVIPACFPVFTRTSLSGIHRQSAHAWIPDKLVLVKTGIRLAPEERPVYDWYANRSLLTELISVMASYLATNRLLLTELMLVLVNTGNGELINFLKDQINTMFITRRLLWSIRQNPWIILSSWKRGKASPIPIFMRTSLKPVQ